MSDNKNSDNLNGNNGYGEGSGEGSGYGEGRGESSGEDSGNVGHGHKGMMKHGVGMMLCCLAPILIIAAIPLLGFRTGGSLAFLAYLICPIGMMVMMYSMSKMNQKDGGSASCHGNGAKKLQDGNSAEDKVL